MKKALLYIGILAAFGFSCCSFSTDKADKDGKKSNSIMSKLSSGGSDENVKTITKTIGEDITAVSSYISADIKYVCSGKRELTVTGPEELVNQLVIEQKGITLALKGSKKQVINYLKGIDVTITLPVLSDVSLYGSGDFTADKIMGDGVSVNLLNSGDLNLGSLVATTAKVNMKGSGDVTVREVRVNNLQTLIMGSGDVKLGDVEAVSVKNVIIGAGDVSIKSMVATMADSKIDGSGNITLDHLKVSTLNLVVNGAGSVRVKGDAATATLAVNGVGDIDARGLKCGTINQRVNGIGEIRTQ